MRDPNRLKSFYEEVERIHREYFPDWRFGQFLSNVVSWYGGDIFYFEEDRMLKLIYDFVKSMLNVEEV